MHPGNWSLLFGPIPVVITVAGAVGMIVLLWDRRRVWWTRVVPIAVLSVVVVVAAISLFIDKVWRPFPDAVPLSVALWAGAGLVALALVVPRMVPRRWWVRVVAVGAAGLVLVAAASGVNQVFGLYASVRAFANVFRDPGVNADQYVAKSVPSAELPSGETLGQWWRPPPNMPEAGALFQTDIPSSGGFRPRSAWVYVPPAYRAVPRPLLPVLVLLGGQPGSPRDWIDSGELEINVNAYAKAHKGLAPVIVMPDILSRATDNPMCLDSRLGNVQTYLTKDVPQWIGANLEVDPDRSKWAIAGFSLGGTCAVQMAMQAPSTYPTFIDISGQKEPTLGTRERTLAEAFGGDAAAFARVNPLDILKTRRFPELTGVFVAGSEDHDYGPQVRELYEASAKAGMNATLKVYPGPHSWVVWRPGLYDQLTWLAGRTGLATG